jgi:hypothetical protein
MNIEHRRVLEQLRSSGWRIEYFDERKALASDVVTRYPWMPSDYREFVEETKIAVSPDEKAWFLTALDFSGESDSAFAWNEWERQSLEAAEDDEALKRQTLGFWDSHLPVLVSVKSGYAYVAIERSDLTVVCGEEPEYEEATLLTSSFAELLHLIAARDPRLSRWI